MLFIRKYLSEIILVLTIVIFLFALANLVKYGFLSLEDLKNNKDSIDAIGSIITSIILIAGAIASYYRFFRGRTFSTRADLAIEVSVHKADDKFFIHSITMELSNLGAFPIRNIGANIEAYNHNKDGELSLTKLGLWKPQHTTVNEKELIQVIFSGEKSQFIAFNKVPKT